MNKPKFKVGDKVKLKKNPKGIYYVGNMKIYLNEVMTITEIFSDNCRVKENLWFWSYCWLKLNKEK